MDVLYNIEAARMSIGKLMRDRAEGKISSVQLASYDKDIGDHFTMVKTIAPKSMWLARKEGDADVKEVVLRVQGAICHHQLPPVLGSRITANNEARFMKQSIRLTGFGCKQFQQAVNSAANLVAFMGQNMDDGSIEQWAPVRFQAWPALEFSNRYFVHQNTEGDMVPVAYSENMDPDGVLAEMAGEDWVHTADNQVSFYKRDAVSDEKPRFVPFDPSMFKKGDLVEVQFSMVAVKQRGKDEQHNVRLILRAVAMLDDKLSKDAINKQTVVGSSLPTAPPTPSKSLKRSVGYMHDEDDDQDLGNTKRMRELSISDTRMDDEGALKQ
ncbi:hypothetical protein HWV62_31706 [Athelia sp. TMB]|nr:hypothetical protein HWV62_31706 [Athelia sp. TMB]